MGGRMIRTLLKAMVMALVCVFMFSTTWAVENAEEEIVPMPAPPIVLMEVPDNIQLDQDVVYAVIDGQELKLDIAYSKADRGNLPAIIHIHGGGWLMGDKNPNQAVIAAQHGFAGISIQYRKADVAKFPAAVHDCKSAVRWVRANAEKYRIDPYRIGVIGDSAGGHLAAIVGVSNGNEYLEGDGPYQEHSSNVQTAVDQFGPTDFARMNDVPGNMDHNLPSGPESQFIGKPVQEAPELVKRANPITYVDAGDPPILILHGEKDLDVIINQSEIFFNALTKEGVPSKFVRVKNAGHGFSAIPEDAVVIPGPEELDDIRWCWFRDVFDMN